MAEQTIAIQPSAKGQVLNDRTYQEVEYLKKNLGPILVAALAEICIRRPADPIEYLGHWLLRWRYNEELKRRDVQNALEVVRQKAWSKDDGTGEAPNQALTPLSFNQGFTPQTPFGPPGFGGPLQDSALVPPEPDEEEEETPAIQAPDAEAEKRLSGQEKRPSGEERRASEGERRLSGEERRPSGEGNRGSIDAGKTASGQAYKEASAEIGEGTRKSLRKSMAPETSQIDTGDFDQEEPTAE